MKVKSLFFILFLITFLFACSGGGGGGSETTDIPLALVDSDGDGLTVGCDVDDNDPTEIDFLSICDSDGDGYVNVVCSAYDDNESGAVTEDELASRFYCDNCVGINNPDQLDDDSDTLLTDENTWDGCGYDTDGDEIYDHAECSTLCVIMENSADSSVCGLADDTGDNCD